MKINKIGNLCLQRGDKMKTQMCPFVKDHNGDYPPQPCGDWCPHFLEPRKWGKMRCEDNISIEITCSGINSDGDGVVHSCAADEFLDEREAADDDF